MMQHVSAPTPVSVPTPVSERDSMQKYYAGLFFLLQNILNSEGNVCYYAQINLRTQSMQGFYFFSGI